MKRFVVSLVLVAASTVIFSAVIVKANVFPPTSTQDFYGDADGDTLVSGPDVIQFNNFVLVKPSTWDTTQPNVPAQNWNTCDLNSDQLCSGPDVIQANNYLLVKPVAIGARPWTLANDLTAGGIDTAPSYPTGAPVPFSISLYSLHGVIGDSGRPGIAVQANIVGGTATGAELGGRTCAPTPGPSTRDQAAAPGATCALAVTISDWGAMPTRAPTESGAFGFTVNATGAGTVILDFSASADAGLDIPATTLAGGPITVTFGGGGDTVSVTCPPVNEDTANVCTIASTGASTCALGTGTTCTGAVITGCTQVDVAAQGEAAGPGSCNIEVTKGAATSIAAMTINEVNQNPAFTSTGPTIATEGALYTYAATVTDADIPAQTLVCSINAGTDTCGGALAGCVYSFTPSEVQGGAVCVAGLTVTDAITGSANQDTSVTVNELNAAPTWTTAPADISISVSSAYNQVNGVAADSDLPSATAGDPGYITCATASNACSFPVTATGAGAGSASCNLTFFTRASAETCSVDVQAYDGAGGIITRNITIVVVQSTTIITIGTGTVAANFPLGTWYHDERTQVIYLASEIGSSATIYSIALDVSTIPGQIMNNFTIRMKHTTLASYGAASWEGPSSGWSTVYQSNESVGSTGWRTFTLTTPFVYNGVDNLLVDFSFNNSSYTSDGICNGTDTGASRTIYYRADSAYGDPLNWSGASNPVPVSSTVIPNVRLELGPAPSCACWQEIGTGSASGGGISNTSGNSQPPSLALDASGYPVVAWQEGVEIYVRRWDGSAWGELAGSASGGGISNNTGTSQDPSLALDSSGYPAVAWYDNTSGNWEIYVRRWNGSAWVELAGSATGGGISNNTGTSGEPSIALDASGYPVVAWRDNTSGNMEIYIKRWDGSAWVDVGTQSSAFGGISSSIWGAWGPSVALDASGYPVVAWHDDNSGDVYLKRWDGSAWVELAGSATGGGISNNTGWSGAPSLALDSGGNPVVAWRDATSGNLEIYVRRWDGSAWVELAGSATGGGISNNTGASQRPSLAVDSSGYPVVAWDDDPKGDAEIYVRRWDGIAWVELAASGSGGGISNNAGISEASSLALDAAGNPVVAWQDDTSGNTEIYVRRWAP